MVICRFGLAAVLLILGASAACPEEPKLTKAEVAKRAKPAVAFVMAKIAVRPGIPGTSQGSAFCVHPSGLFVTNAHVVRGATEIELVLNPSQKDEKVYKATVLRTAETDDLALLSVETKSALSVLPLGDDSVLEELTDVVACGYPFGSALAFGAKDYPSITTTSGAISSLRKKEGQLELIQLDVNLNPGNSGGPVLDLSGKVVGVVVAGIKGSQINFAIPIRRVAMFLAKTEFTFTTPAVRTSDRGKAVPVEARLISFNQDAGKVEVELEVRYGKTTTHHPMKSDKGVYRADVVLLPERKGTYRLTLEASFTDGSLSGSTDDREVKIGATAHKLSAIRTIAPAKGQAFLWSGVQLDGKVIGLEAVPITLGGKSLTANLSTAQEVALRPVGDEPVLVLEVAARRGGKEIGRQTRTVLLNEDSKVYLAELTPSETKPGPWPLAVGMNGSAEQNLPIKVNGQAYPKGLGLHAGIPSASATYRLGRTASAFRTTVAFNDSNDRATSPVHFEVYGDGKLLWKSKGITARGQKDDCLVAVNGVDVLELRVGFEDKEPKDLGAHSVWLDPILVGPDPAAIRRAASHK